MNSTYTNCARIILTCADTVNKFIVNIKVNPGNKTILAISNDYYLNAHVRKQIMRGE